MSGQYPEIRPIRFSRIYLTPESRKERFQVNASQPDKAKVRWAYFSETDFKGFKKNLPIIFNGNHIGVETVCRNYGLNAQAKTLRTKRHQQVLGLLNRLGFLSKDEKGDYIIDQQAITAYEASLPPTQPV